MPEAAQRTWLTMAIIACTTWAILMFAPMEGDPDSGTRSELAFWIVLVMAFIWFATESLAEEADDA